ncbi:LMBR1-like conserved region family protein [Trichomonas vaginalis G3]|uniref:LMBR1-like conserved region family protein n=1 Tax=Trichomonas vaginalis (strain ATCC PRA-98 / G3) TaxID=412133 RepID=A2EHB0_TRIV3|nr:LMBR1-like membrane protein family [Trichomonas vaginalis G3]EAY07989.1 LMBR1-like conserved region family protein [Trichomonas vaginalis G3]KAI5486035.1 LMBR1-like membrane protein family [Trichomonas vaginalis G3]|eukprot:XP_001320212.1 LMBR1-like conserved region family protein [Trichomonas vaginalis G3]
MDLQSIICLVSCVVLIAVITVFYWFYGAFRHPAWASSFMVFSACIPVIIVSGILPYDISLNLFGHTNETPKVLYICLEILYWTSFILTWIIVPFAVSYLSYSHSISIKHRIWFVIRENLIFFGVAGGLVLIFGIVMIATKKLDPKGLFSLAIALGNAYGLILQCLAFGYAFVKVPMNIWRNADPGFKYKNSVYQLFKETKRCAAAVADADAALDHWRRCRENIEGEMAEKYLDLGRPRAENIDLLKSALPIPERFYTSQCTNRKINAVRKIDWKHCTEANIEDFFYLMDQTANALDQCKNYVNYTAVVAEKSLAKFKKSVESGKKASITKILIRAADILLMVLIGISFYNEILMIPSKQKYTLFNYLSHCHMSQYIGQILITFPLISFYLFLGGWALVQLRIGSFYRFIAHASNGNTLNYWAILIARFGPTVGYHYMLQVGASNAAFVKVMGNMNDVYFIGNSFNYISPSIMIIVAIFVAFDIWDRIKPKLCCKAFHTYPNDVSLAWAKDLQVGEEVLCELSLQAKDMIDSNKAFSVVNIGEQRTADYVPVEDELMD